MTKFRTTSNDKPLRLAGIFSSSVFKTRLTSKDKIIDELSAFHALIKSTTISVNPNEPLGLCFFDEINSPPVTCHALHRDVMVTVLSPRLAVIRAEHHTFKMQASNVGYHARDIVDRIGTGLVVPTELQLECLTRMTPFTQDAASLAMSMVVGGYYERYGGMKTALGIMQFMPYLLGVELHVAHAYLLTLLAKTASNGAVRALMHKITPEYTNEGIIPQGVVMNVLEDVNAVVGFGKDAALFLQDIPLGSKWEAATGALAGVLQTAETISDPEDIERLMNDASYKVSQAVNVVLETSGQLRNLASSFVDTLSPNNVAGVHDASQMPSPTFHVTVNR
jgi:spore maturation protein SpmA